MKPRLSAEAKDIERQDRLNKIENILSMLDDLKRENKRAVQLEIQNLSYDYPDNKEYKTLGDYAKLLSDLDQETVNEVARELFNNFAMLAENLREALTPRQFPSIQLYGELEELSESFAEDDDIQKQITRYQTQLENSAALKDRQQQLFSEVQEFIRTQRTLLQMEFGPTEEEPEIKESLKEVSTKDKLAEKIQKGEITQTDLLALKKFNEDYNNDVIKVAVQWRVDKERGKESHWLTAVDWNTVDVEAVKSKIFEKKISAQEEIIVCGLMNKRMLSPEKKLTGPDMQFLKKIWEGQISKEEVILLLNSNLEKLAATKDPQYIGAAAQEFGSSKFSREIADIWDAQYQALEQKSQKSSTAQMIPIVAPDAKDNQSSKLNEVMPVLEILSAAMESRTIAKPPLPPRHPETVKDTANNAAKEAMDAALHTVRVGGMRKGSGSA